MVLSMTAFGRGVVRTPTGSLQVLISSVNRKHLDVVCQLPEKLAHVQPVVRRRLQDCAQRGMVTVTVLEEISSQQAQRRLLARAENWERISEQLSPKWERQLTLDLLNYEPGSGDEGMADEMAQTALLKAVDLAIAEWLQARRSEGETLAQDLLKRVEDCRQLVQALMEWAERIRPQMAERLHSDVQIQDLPLEEQDRVAREWAQLIDKADATEEIVRLLAHLKRADELLHLQTPVGKSLEFLFQELMREANTLTSKLAQVRWGSADPIHQAVSLKTEIERMREQSQNLE
jgi:uncharacterized protein (TIGR00255 family)